MSEQGNDGWLELSLTTDREQAMRLAGALEDAFALSVSLTDASDQPVYEPDPGSTPLWPTTRVSGLFRGRAELESALGTLRGCVSPRALPAYRVGLVHAADWVTLAQASCGPIEIGERLWICPPGRPPPSPAACCVWMEPGLAFGAGTHETTALCLEWLDGARLEGKRIVDYGCGSGILGIAALKLGAAEALAVDHDAQALASTAANAARNDVSDRLRAVLPVDLPDQQADVLLANILLEPLLGLAERFSRVVRSGGMIVLSGVLRQHVGQLRLGYAPWFDLDAVAERGDWVRVTGRRA